MLGLRPCFLLRLDGMDLAQKLVCCNHGHPTKVGHEMNTISVTSDVALRALLRVLATELQHLAAVATPRWLHVRNSLEAMGYTVVDLVFVFFLRNLRNDNQQPRKTVKVTAGLTASAFDLLMHLVTTFGKHSLWQVYRQSSH